MDSIYTSKSRPTNFKNNLVNICYLYIHNRLHQEKIVVQYYWSEKLTILKFLFINLLIYKEGSNRFGQKIVLDFLTNYAIIRL